MFKIYLAACFIQVFSIGCLSQASNLGIKTNGPYSELLQHVYLKSVEWHSLIDNKFYEVHSNLSRVIMDVNGHSVTSLVKGVAKLETLRSQVKAFLNSRTADDQNCISKIHTKTDKLLFKMGTKISDCAVLADQQIQGISNKKIDLGTDILEVSELLLSGTLEVITDHFARGGSFNDLPDIQEEYEEAFAEADDEIYNEVIPNIHDEMNSMREEALDIPAAVEECVSNVLTRLNDVVGDTGKLVERCGTK
ncbi:uncharacterized protein LOC119081813 [Bradysia coprophila]|uniref:uncharacterized protein LOC119081813 n=1 Tax=Bradysia coprophila TaxID=38358 RepID=UPI00187DB51A|nr:uncharacterized protein LOC119081813 [Bradysia coprophila]